jgi:L-ascorbate metabolism protein UlaG (beta-lactamase superfamily)
MNVRPWAPIEARVLLAGWVAAVLSVCATGAPVLAPFPEFVSSEGAAYAGVLHLDDYVEDSTATDADLVWRVTESAALDIQLTRERHLIVRTQDEDWCGVAAVILTVCNPLGECAAQTVAFRVEAVPDDPVIDWIPAQVVGESAAFRPLDLRCFGWDPDDDAALTWSASDGVALTVSVVDGVLCVAPRDPAWRGTEQVVLSLCDSTGRKASRVLSYTVTDGVPVSLTFIQGRLFSIEAGETKIVIDGLLRDAIALSATEKEHLARAEPPFDGIALALATHEHYDHVTPEFVVEYLTSSRSTLFASVAETVDLLERVPGYAAIADRVVGIPFEDGRSADLYLAGVHVTAFSVRHGGEGVNLAFLIELGGAKILVLGDASFDFTPAELVAAYGWPNLSIDVAIVSPLWVEGFDGTLVTQGIAPRFVVSGPLLRCPPFATVQDGSPIPVFVCERVETWILPPRVASSSND